MTGDKLIEKYGQSGDRAAKRTMRQQETLDRIGEHRQRHREQVIETARSRPFMEKVYCGAGWIPILVDFVTSADKHPGFVLVAARENWGQLHLDYVVDQSAADASRAREQDAIDESSRTCEICGADGYMRLDGWRKVLCDRHALERRLTLTEAEHEALMQEFSASQDRWRPILERHRNDYLGSDELFERLLAEFPDLDPLPRRFWAVNLTRIILAGREKDEE